MFAVEELGANARLALDTIHQRPTKGIPSWLMHIMQHDHIERLAGAQPGDYVKDPDGVYLEFLRAIGVCMLDQYLATNPMSMGDRGYEGKRKGATTGAHEIVLDGIAIDSPEAVLEHFERVVWPGLRTAMAEFDEDQRVAGILAREADLAEKLGPDILKTGHGFIRFPGFSYGAYGYANYLMAYVLYPEMMEKHYSLQADLALLNNNAAARAYREGNLPPIYRLDHDLADSRGTLVNVESLDRLWFPHFARCLEPMLKTDVKMLWHCDGNLMEMVPRLIEVGLKGFQGFQYECGMDYPKICRMKAKDGDDLMIIAGVSVTCSLPLGPALEVKREIDWLVEHGPRTGLFLGPSSSVTPGVPWENIRTFIDGVAYYRTHGRG